MEAVQPGSTFYGGYAGVGSMNANAEQLIAYVKKRVNLAMVCASKKARLATHTVFQGHFFIEKHLDRNRETQIRL